MAKSRGKLPDKRYGLPIGLALAVVVAAAFGIAASGSSGASLDVRQKSACASLTIVVTANQNSVDYTVTANDELVKNGKGTLKKKGDTATLTAGPATTTVRLEYKSPDSKDADHIDKSVAAKPCPKPRPKPTKK